jgi:mannose-6-phosphate isomerase
MDLLRFEPIYQDRVWGGNNLHTDLGRAIPTDNPIGEAWDIVDRPEAQSVCIQSRKPLSEILSDSKDTIMGPTWSSASGRFPILVKWLDCQDRLSLQVHPPADVADLLNGEPKTECWFIAKAKPQAHLFLGLKATVTQAEFERVLTDSGGSGLTPLIHRVPVKDGDSILLESGRIHAIDAGNLILEIQQNSDTTYRVYDWDRVGLDGQPRQLHIEQSLRSIDFNDFEPKLTPSDFESQHRVIAQCDAFRIRQINLKEGEFIDIASKIEPSIISVINGEMEARKEVTQHQQVLRCAENVLCPYSWGGRLIAREKTTLLLTDRFLQA